MDVDQYEDVSEGLSWVDYMGGVSRSVRIVSSLFVRRTC